MHNFQLNSFMHAMPMDIVDLYHSISLSVTLALAGGHKASTKQTLLISFYWSLFNLFKIKLDVVKKQLSLNILILLLSYIYV